MKLETKRLVIDRIAPEGAGGVSEYLFLLRVEYFVNDWLCPVQTVSAYAAEGAAETVRETTGGQSLRFVSDWFCYEVQTPVYMVYSVDGVLHYTVRLKENDDVVGHLFIVREADDAYNVGLCIDTGRRGRGYATEAMAVLLDYLFGCVDARRIYAFVQDRHRQSVRLCTHFGMSREECFSGRADTREDKAKFEDICVYSISVVNFNFAFL